MAGEAHRAASSMYAAARRGASARGDGGAAATATAAVHTGAVVSRRAAGDSAPEWRVRPLVAQEGPKAARRRRGRVAATR